VCTFFNRRWDSDALTIKKVLASGVLGEVHRIDSRFERFRPELNATSWRENMSAADGGGQLLDLQPHLISTAIDWFGTAELVTASVRSLRGGADDDSVLVLHHKSGVMSYLSASAVVGAPGPRIRILGTKGALVINELDPQEALLRAGKFPENGTWTIPTSSQAFIHRGENVEEIQSIPGNYGHFYKAVDLAITSGAPWPVPNSDALLVASIIDQAREIGTRAH
jgi:predicted dehydrogenase